MPPPSPAQLFADVRARVQTLAPLGEGLVFDGLADKAIPVDRSGAIRPYVVLGAGIGSPIPDQPLCGVPSWDAIDWRFETRCFGPTADHVRRLAWDLTLALSGFRVADGLVKPDDDAFRIDAPIADPGIVPARFFLPLPWRLVTT